MPAMRARPARSPWAAPRLAGSTIAGTPTGSPSRWRRAISWLLRVTWKSPSMMRTETISPQATTSTRMSSRRRGRFSWRRRAMPQTPSTTRLRRQRSWTTMATAPRQRGRSAWVPMPWGAPTTGMTRTGSPSRSRRATSWASSRWSGLRISTSTMRMATLSLLRDMESGRPRHPGHSISTSVTIVPPTMRSG